MQGSSKAVIMMLMVGIGIFGYSQYASAAHIGAVITQSELVAEDETGSIYNVELLFDNPSLLVFTAGTSEFFVMAENRTVGNGQLEPFVLPPLGSTVVNGMFQTDSDLDQDGTATLKISGSTKYDILFTSVEIPFVFYPTEEQTREFIDGS